MAKKSSKKASSSQARDKVIKVELTTEEQALVNLAAARCQQNMKGFARSAVLREARRLASDIDFVDPDKR
jgi:uncharacterized protein (DUF1778 family)